MKEEQARTAVALHQRRLFAFALGLLAGDKDRAHDVCASACAEALRTVGAVNTDRFLAEACRLVVEKARVCEVIPFKPAEPGVGRLVRAALDALSLEDKTFVLLRDQMNLGYGDIAKVTGASKSEAKNRTVAARFRLREKMAGILRHER